MVAYPIEGGEEGATDEEEEEEDEEEELVAGLKGYFQEVIPSLEVASSLLADRTKQCFFLVSFMV